MATNSPTSPQTFQSLLWSRCRSCFRRRRNEGSMGSPIGGCSCSCDDPSFPAVDPAAQIRGVDRRGAVSGRVLLRPHASARETPASAALAAAASGAEVHPRPQELSPPRAGAGAGAVARPALGHKKTKRKPKLESAAGCYQNRFASHFNLSAGLCRAAISQFSKLLVSIGWGIAI